MPEKAPPSYYAHLVACFNLKNNTALTKAHTFTTEELLTLQPDDLYRYGCVKVYGKPDPDTEVDKPTHGRSTSIEFLKKAISFYMPNRLVAWNAETKSGNPTRSVPLNDLIKAVKKKEVRKLGKMSQARRAFEETEFTWGIKKLRSSACQAYKYTVSAFFIFQFTLIARLDDIANFSLNDLTPNIEFMFALNSKMCWSKNVLEERDSPDQIIFGARDPTYCAHLGLGLHLETAIEAGNVHDGGTLFGVKKTYCSQVLRDIINDPDFPKVKPGNLGSHSNRKFPATYARRKGCSRDDVDLRGRWKGNKRIVDTYIDVSLPVPDARVAAVLCVGGAIKYGISPKSSVTDEWIVQNVSPNIARLCPRQVAVVLGRALLWAIYDEEMSNVVPASMVARVKTIMSTFDPHLPEHVNPIKKITLVISGAGACLQITEIEDLEDNNGNEIVPTVQNGGGNMNVVGGGSGGSEENSAHMRALFTLIAQLKEQNEELKNEVSVFKSTTNDLLKKTNCALQRISLIPVKVRQTTRTTTHNETITKVIAAPMPYETTLLRNPRNLFVLWQEYMFGIAGRRAAREFTSAERGRVKFTFSLRKVFWDKVQLLTQRGHTFNTAIDAIYEYL